MIKKIHRQQHDTHFFFLVCRFPNLLAGFQIYFGVFTCILIVKDIELIDKCKGSNSSD